MRTSQAARYARWAAAAAILLAVCVAGVYAWRAWQARQAARNAPPPVPATVTKRSEGFSFSKVEGQRTLFTVRASQATEFKEGGKSLLEDVWITIYGRAGRRFDNIHTRQCDYLPDSGRIVCAGEVQMDLESAEEAKQHPGERVIHIATDNISFDRETGQATTDRPVVFRFPYGHGRGVGVTYSTRDAVVRLHREVEVTLDPTGSGLAPTGSGSSSDPKVSPHFEPTVLTGAALEYHRNDSIMRLLGPVSAKQGPRELTAGLLALKFDAELRAQRLTATEKPALRSVGQKGESTLTADEFVALLHRRGYIERILATGNVNATSKDATGEDRLTAQRLEMEMVAGQNQPRLLTAGGNVKVDSNSPSESRRLQTETLRLNFSPATRAGARGLDHAETLTPATVELRQGEETTRVRAERLAADFGPRNRVRQLSGNSGVEIERRFGNRPAQQTASQQFTMQFGSRGEWTEAEQAGNVRFREGERTAQADRAQMVRSTELLSLSGSAAVADAVSRTAAQAIVIHQRSGEVRAEGNVRTSYFKAEPSGLTNLAPQPAHISADVLRANRDAAPAEGGPRTEAGRVLYSGHARLWQGDAVIEADSIELARGSAGEERRLDARGNVRAIFPQAENSSPAGTSARVDAALPAGPAPAGGRAGGPGERTIWRVRAGSLTYRSAEAQAHLEENVFAESRVGQIQSQKLDLFLAPAASGPAQGSQQLTRAQANGNVTVRQGGRRGVAERSDYLVGEGKFVLTGGKPTLFDPVLGATTGRQLTFFLADDKILIDSEEGSRTVTRHRVEK